MRLRRQRPDLRLVLTAVPDVAAVQPPRLPGLDQIDGVEIIGTVSPETARDYVAAADAVVVEGTSTLFEAAIARTPVVMVPGLIHETALEGTWVNEGGAGIVLRPEHVTHRTMAGALRAALHPVEGRERSQRLSEFVGNGGRDLAVSTILGVIAELVCS
jgi:UDP:flavonoid glycosyltransferase YjiC (YdhE family)